MAIAGHPSFASVYGPTVDEVAGRYAEVLAEAENGCPVATTSGGRVTWEGECETETTRWSGRWVHEEGDGVLDAPATVSAWADGADRYQLSGTQLVGKDGAITRMWAYVLEETTGDAVTGSWEIDTDEVWGPTDEMTGRYAVDLSDGRVGGYCLAVEQRWGDTCAREPAGGWVMQGLDLLRVTFDPGEACDGCGRVVFDGFELPGVCGAPAAR
jgi:hypothetical protein